MEKERWKKISRIFDVALTLPKEHRTTYIRKICADDQELQKEIDQLLESMVESEGMLEEQLQKNKILIDRFATHLDKTKPKADDYLRGHTIKNWKLTELLGYGGMGSVYKAQRIDPDIHQIGAVKIMHQNLKNPANVGRFRLEQQILASLNHPNIASLIEGGVNEDGLPWMVLEYIEGEPLLEYCDKHRLSIRQRLELFKTICNAVEYAHKNLIVHRDLKPENIFVTDEGYIKILDFGIAKLLDPEIYDLPIAETRPGMQLMSFEYAAPEQTSGETVTTSTDIYALGILLYELLAGMHPFDFEEKKYPEIVQIIRESNPAPPSRKLAGLPDQSFSKKIAESRSLKSSRLFKILKGDLDAIILKAIRKNPERRYDAVSQLAGDITSYLSNKPVSARRRVFLYRVQKFWKRHKKGAVAAAVFMVVVTSLITFYTIRLAEERNAARLEAETAEEVSSFLVSLFEANQPGVAQGDALTARMLLERGVERAEELDEQPVVQARMFDQIGRAYRTMGYYDQAEPLIRRALALRKNSYGEHHAEVANSLNHLGLLQKERGDYTAADSLYRQALTIMRDTHDGDHPEIAESLNNLGVLHRIQGDYDTAETYLHESLTMWQSLYGSEHPQVAKTMQNSGALLMVQEKYGEAEKVLRQALEMEKKLHGEQHPMVATVLLNLAHVLKEQDRHDEAEPLYRNALAIQRDIYEKDNTEIAQTMNNLAVLLTETEHFDEAEMLLQEATDIRRRELGENHKEYVASLHNLAFFQQNKGDYGLADSLYRITLDKWRNLLGPNHPNVAVTLNNLASVQKAMNHNEAAERNYLQVLSLRRSTLGENHSSVKRSVQRLVELYESWNKPALATAYRDTLSSFK